MTEITDEGRKLAAELANKARTQRGADPDWTEGHFVSDADDLSIALARLATDHLALKAEHEKAVADLREVDRLGHEHGPESPATRMVSIRTIAAKYRETDPLVSELAEALELTHVHFSSEECATALIAELSKRGFELARVKP